ncbi:MAG: hypothetical protein Q9201_007109 [Fulgogasparrea decipioides]
MERLPGFLRIPPEIREQIYSDLFHDQPSSLPALLTVHPRILGEIRPWIFKLPITFNGQQSLFEWLSAVGSGFLPNVGHIRFKLHDIDPEKIVGALGERLRRARIQDSAYYIGNPYEEACATELYHIKTSLQKLKNLRSLTIIESTSADPKPPPNMMKAFLALILADLPLVSISTPHKLLRYLDQPNTSLIRGLQVTDHRLIIRPDFPTNKFPNLLELKLCCGCSSTGMDQSNLIRTIPHSAILWENLPALQSLTMCLYDYKKGINSDKMRQQAALFRYFSRLEKHSNSLRKFRLWCNDRPSQVNSGNLGCLLSFLRHSSLTHFETGYWWTPPLDCFPASVITIGIRFETNHDQYPNWIMAFHDEILPSHSTFFAEHPHLKEILLYLPSHTKDKFNSVNHCYAAANSVCREYGVRLKVIYEDCACDHMARTQRRELGREQ